MKKSEKDKTIFYFGFNEKNKFLIEFEFLKDFGNREVDRLIYKVEYNGEIDGILTSPVYYNKDIILIETIFCNLTKGKEAMLKFKSDILNEIMVINDERLYIKKNEEGILEVKLQPKVDKIVIAKKKRVIIVIHIVQLQKLKIN